MDRFQTEVKNISSDTEILKYAKIMESDYVVSTQKTFYDRVTGKFMSHYQNVNVLSGSIKSVELTKKEVNNFLENFKGTFKTEFKTHSENEGPKL